MTLVPFIGPSGEQKTKPTQHSVTEFRSRGIQPDVIVCRSEEPLSDDLKRKISNLCDVDERGGQRCRRRNIYELPLILHDEGLDDVVWTYSRLDAEPTWPVAVRGPMIEEARSSREDRDDRQVHQPARRLPLGRREPQARRVPSWRRGDIDWIQAEDVEGLLASGRLSSLDGIVIPVGSASVESKARSPLPASLVRTRFPASGSASECR